MLANVVPDVHLVATLMSFSRVIPEKNKALAREVVRRVVEELLALNDDGAPFYDKSQAAFLASLGVPVFACTPDRFPDLMVAALNRQDLSLWVSQNIQS
nr:hypothetical protein [Cardiobacterium valvarum]